MDLGFFKKSIPTLIGVAVVGIISIYVGYRILTPEKKLPIYNPAYLPSQLVDSSKQRQRKNHTIADFSLINQNGEVISAKNYENKIYVADFFFTTCPSICIAMTKNMGMLQKEFKNDNDVMFLSHSVTPEKDSVPVLRAYADKKGVIDSKWNLVTGDKKQIYNLARTSYFAVLESGDGGASDFIHTENFVLVDKKKRIRGTYDGTNLDDIQQLIKDIRFLKNDSK